MREHAGQVRRWAAAGALPVACGTLCVLLLCRAFTALHPGPWGILAASIVSAIARWGLDAERRPWHALENGWLCALAVLAITQLAPPLQPLAYLLAAAYVLALPLPLAIPLLVALVALDAGLTPQWPESLAHASFIALFAGLYHLLLGGRLAAARRAESLAVSRRI